MLVFLGDQYAPGYVPQAWRGEDDRRALELAEFVAGMKQRVVVLVNARFAAAPAAAQPPSALSGPDGGFVRTYSLRRVVARSRTVHAHYAHGSPWQLFLEDNDAPGEHARMPRAAGTELDGTREEPSYREIEAALGGGAGGDGVGARMRESFSFIKDTLK